MARTRYLFSYDISDDKRRTKVFETLRDHGDHLQYSVFLCELSRREHAELRATLTPLLHHGEDQLVILDLGPATRDVTSCLDVIGKPYTPPDRVLVV